MSGERKLIVVAGPTAVGKTAVAIRLAQHYQTEIISADSRQFFRELTIGTAKPDRRELEQVRHHFIDSHSISESYDAASFGEDALKLIHELLTTHRHVLLCGGSGLYIRAVVDGFDDIPDVDPGIRESLITSYDANGIEWLQEEIRKRDPGFAATADLNNPHRLIRALEVIIGTGVSIVAFRGKKRRHHDFSVVRIGLDLPREELYQRIDYRMDQMIASGLFDEAATLFPLRHHQALQTVGYQEIFGYMEGKYDRAEAVRLLKRNSRHYAKRQLTWFRRDPFMKWFRPADFDNIVRWIDHYTAENGNNG